MAINKNQKTDFKTSAITKPRKQKPYFKETKTPVWYLLPFIFVLAVIPLIIRYKGFENGLSTTYWHNSNVTSADIFLAWKSTYLIAFGAILLFLLIIALVVETKKFKFEIEYAPLTVYLVFVVLSTFASENIYFSLHGIENHFESMWVLLAYVILAFYGAIMVDNTKAIKIVIYGWLAGTWVLLLIGVFQAFKLDIFTTEFLKKIVLPSNMQDTNLKLNFELGQVYITLYNPNYVGYFAAITIPVFLTLAIAVKEYWKKGLFVLTVIGVFICAIGSGAKNGVMALAGAFVFLIIMLRKYLKKYWYALIAALVVFVIVFIGINSIRGNKMISSLKTAFKTMFTEDDTSRRHLDDIKCGSDGIYFTYEGREYTLGMSVEGGSTIGASLFDENEEQLLINNPDDESSLISSSDDFPIKVTPVVYNTYGYDLPCLQVEVDGYSYVFTNQLSAYGIGDEGYFYLNASAKWTTIESAETALFDNHQYLFTRRGYIWARSIPLLKEHIFIGSGPDTFSLEFPNNDYVDAAYLGYLNQIITKPHNIYLQIGVQTGVISMLAFIAFFMIYFIRSIMLYWKHPLDTVVSHLGIGISAGMFAYMISGIINDSTITYAPVFWGLMGVGIAVNRLVKNEFEARPKLEETNNN